MRRPRAGINTGFKKTTRRLNAAIATLVAIYAFGAIPAAHAGDHSAEPNKTDVLLAPHLGLDAKMLQAGVTVNTTVENSSTVDDLVKAAQTRSEEGNNLDEHVKKYRRLHQKVWAKSKDALNYIFYYRGDSPSSEMGDVILNEKAKVKNKGSAEWQRQVRRDETELAAIGAGMELAAALGSDDAEAAKDVDSAYASLKELVGDDAAQKTLSELKSWQNKYEASDEVYQGKVWSISQRQAKQKSIMQICIDTDPAIQDVVAAVHKYNKHSKLYLVTSRTVKTTLGVASMSPTIVAPASQIALFVYTMATGGAEEDKMLRELYLDKRLASRSRVIGEKSHLALENYQIARLTKNPVLMTYCESVIKQMTGPAAVSGILAAPTVSSTETATPPPAVQKNLATSDLLPSPKPN